MKEEILRLEHTYLKEKNINIIDDFNMNLYKGEFLILFGLFGSGIREIGEVLAGQKKLTEGTFYFDEDPMMIKRKCLSERLGIYSVYNTDNLIPDLTVAENLFLSWNNKLFEHVMPKKKLQKQADYILKKFNISISSQNKAAKLSKVEQQIVKLIRAYVKGAKLVIVHDVADIYTTKDYQNLENTIKILMEEGISFLWITGKISRITKIASRLIVMKRGKNVRTFFQPQIGRVLDGILDIYQESIYGNEIPWLNHNSNIHLLKADRILDQELDQISFHIYESEVVGIWGLDSKHLERIKDILLGEYLNYSGSMYLYGQKYHPIHFYDAVKQGICFVDMMNIENNLVQSMTIEENLVLKNMKKASRYGLFLNSTIEKYIGKKFEELWNIKASKKVIDLDYEQMQNVIFEKFAQDNSKLIVGLELFSMLDYARVKKLINHIQDMTEKKKSILVLSVNYEDLKYFCNRIYILEENKIKSCIARKDYDDFNIIDIVNTR